MPGAISCVKFCLTCKEFLLNFENVGGSFNQVQIGCGGGGIVVRILAFYFGDLRSNPAGD